MQSDRLKATPENVNTTSLGRDEESVIMQWGITKKGSPLNWIFDGGIIPPWWRSVSWVDDLGRERTIRIGLIPSLELDLPRLRGSADCIHEGSHFLGVHADFINVLGV